MTSWRKQGYGFKIHRCDLELRFVNMRVADDVLLVGPICVQIKAMSNDVQYASLSAGLLLNFGITQIVSKRNDIEGSTTLIGHNNIHALSFSTNFIYFEKRSPNQFKQTVQILKYLELILLLNTTFITNKNPQTALQIFAIR